MSYDIYIGECIAVANDEGKYHVTVARCVDQDAPVFDDDPMTGNGNSRHPGYSQWTEWCDTVGLTSLFFDGDKGLMRSHPGAFALRKEHLVTISNALTKWEERNPDSVPGFGNGQDAFLARLIWLEWWVRWALDRCQLPAIYNS